MAVLEYAMPYLTGSVLEEAREEYLAHMTILASDPLR